MPVYITYLYEPYLFPIFRYSEYPLQQIPFTTQREIYSYRCGVISSELRLCSYQPVFYRLISWCSCVDLFKYFHNNKQHQREVVHKDTGSRSPRRQQPLYTGAAYLIAIHHSISTVVIMPDTFNNIFLTTENLAFSLPLIIVCATYVSVIASIDSP